MSPDLSEFSKVSGVGADKQARPCKRRRPPFSMRLSEAEYERLVADANGLPLGTYVKSVLLQHKPVRTRRAGIKIEDRKALAKALALLGQSRLSSNINQLARLANIGALPVSQETEAELAAACADIRELRQLLVEAIGLQVEVVP